MGRGRRSRPTRPAGTAAVVSRLTVVGLGPGDLERTPGHIRSLLDDEAVSVILRTAEHPAAATLSGRRPVQTCDDLYGRFESFDDLYPAIAERVLSEARERRTVYAVPGSPLVGERSVTLLRQAAETVGIEVDVLPAESFIDAVCVAARIDPLFDGLQVFDGRSMPHLLWFDSPTIIGHVDVPVVLADVIARLGGVLGHDSRIGLASDLGSENGTFEWTTLGELDTEQAGYRVSLVVPASERGLRGAIEVVRHLRKQCPWDREQTHHSITHNLVEEAHELAEALSALSLMAPDGEPDFGAYADVEEELGDVLFQVLFHATMGEEAGALTVDSLAEVLRSKLVRRHPHVFGDVDVDSADEVVANWDVIKAAEKQRSSRLDGVPHGMPPVARAHKIQERAARAGFDWASAEPVRRKLDEELGELAEAQTDADRLHELGDVLFTVVNLSRHLGVDPAVALRRTTARFEARFRAMEGEADLDGLSLEELDALWERVK